MNRHLARKTNWKRFYNYLQKTGKLSNPKTLDALIYVRAYWDFEFFARYFFEEHCIHPFSSMHLEFCEDEKDPERRGRREAIAAPRGNAKTTFKLLFKALHAIVYGYEPFILVIGQSAPDAQEKVKDILDELETNERLKRVYGNLAPIQGRYDGVARWGTKRFITQNGVLVLAKSRGHSLRGLKHGAHRPSLIILDDVETTEGVLNPVQREKNRDWFFKVVMKLGRLQGTTNILVIGTCVHPESLLMELLYSPGWDGRRYQAVIRFAENQSLWEEYRKILTNLMNPKRSEDSKNFYLAHEEAMLKGAEVLWPEGESYEYLMQVRILEGEASFNSEKQNEPYDPEKQLFQMDSARRFRIEYDKSGNFLGIRWLDGTDTVVKANEIERVIAYHDPALGKKPGQTTESDYAAIVVAASDVYGHVYCLHAYVEKDPPSRQVEQVFRLQQFYGFKELYLEENNFQKLMKEVYLNAQEKRTDGLTLRVHGVTQHENKIKRISTLEPAINNGELLFAKDLSPRFIDQLKYFPTSYDDGPDALHGAYRQLNKRPNSITTLKRGHVIG